MVPVSNTEENVPKRIPIYNLHSGKNSPPRYCDLIIDGSNVYLEKKQSKEKFDSIPWEDLRYQVCEALGISRNCI